MEDVHAVMDAVGSDRAVLFGTSEGGNMSILFAATYPDRTAGLILHGCQARGEWAPDYPWAATKEETEKQLVELGRDWGGAIDLRDGARVSQTINWLRNGPQHICGIRQARRQRLQCGNWVPK